MNVRMWRFSFQYMSLGTFKPEHHGSHLQLWKGTSWPVPTIAGQALSILSHNIQPYDHGGILIPNGTKAGTV